MRVYLKSVKRMIDTVGEYNEKTKELIVLKGSKVSGYVSEAENLEEQIRLLNNVSNM